MTMNLLTICGVSGLALATAFFSAPADAAPLDEQARQRLAPPQHVVETGNEAPLIRYGRTMRGGAHTNGAWSGGWQVTHALACWAGDRSADEKMLEQIRYVLRGENIISANGGYPTQHERHMTASFAILRHADRFWQEQLTEQERHKIDLVMKASLIASAYTTADASYADGARGTALDGDTNMHRNWNPNFREGMFGGLIAAMVYFGGPDAASQILNTYDHAAFVEQLEQAGLSNIHETFTWAANHPDSRAPSGEQIEQNIRNYRHEGQPLRDPFSLYAWLTLNTYNRPVSPGLNDGQGQMGSNGVLGGFVVSGQQDLPNRGEVGMLTEFASVDAGGPRSSISYAYDGFRPNLSNHLLVVIGGYWQPGGQADELLRRLETGITDIEYKLEHGYRNFQHGRGSEDVFNITRENWDWSFRTTIPLWREVLQPFHQAR
jgi:hypothetical protein